MARGRSARNPAADIRVVPVVIRAAASPRSRAAPAAAVFLWLACQGRTPDDAARSREVPASRSQQGLYLGLRPPRETPEILAPNVVSTRRDHSAAMFGGGGT